MELKSRHAAIIKELLETDSGISVDKIVFQYGITKRTFYYDFDTINEWLEEHKYGVIKVSNQLVFLISTKRDLIKKDLEHCSYYFSIDERKILEFFFIALSNQTININTFQRYFDISKNTVLADIRNLKESFDNDEISLFSTAKQGYILQGEEFAIRKSLGKYFNKIDSYYLKEEIKKLLQGTLESMIGKNFDFYEIARCLIKQYEIDIKSQLYTGYLEFECTMILISWIRALKGNTFTVSSEEKDTLNITKSYASVVQNSEKLRFHGLYIPDNEVYYVTSLLLGIRTIQFSSQEQEDLYIYNFVNKLIKNFEIVACVQIKDKEHLGIRLRSHIRPFYYRLKYGLQEENTLVSQIQKMYPEAFDFCKKAIKEIDSKISEIISDDEIAYVTVYFVGTQTYNVSFHSDILVKPQILLINEKGRAQSDLLITQLQEMFGEDLIYETRQESDLKQLDLDVYSTIIYTGSVLDVEERYKPKLVKVKQAIDEETYAAIVSILVDQGVSYRDDQLIKKIIDDIKQNVSVSFNETKLYMDLFKTVHSFRSTSEYVNKRKTIQNLIKEHKYRFLQGDVTWESVTFEGYKGVYGQQRAFTKLSSESQLEEQRSYVYNITSNIMLVYCFDYSHISEDRISIVVSSQEIAVNETNRANIFIFFACRNDYRHFPHLKEIYDSCLAMNEQKIKALLKQEDY